MVFRKKEGAKRNLDANAGKKSKKPKKNNKIKM
jgi:hypothetical protein